MDLDYCHNMLTSGTENDKNWTTQPRSQSYKDLVDANYCPLSHLLAIRTSSTRDRFNGLSASIAPPSRKKRSSFPSALSPSCILDAPDLRNDFYLNLMDWGTHGILAIALHQSVHLYSHETGKIETIDTCATRRDYVTSVKWAQATSCDRKTCLLAVGTFLSELQLWDVDTLTKIRSLRSHSERIGSLSWKGHNILTSGSRDATIQLTDVRCAQYAVQTVLCTKGEICGLSWSRDGSTLASGSSNHQLCLWDHAMMRSSGWDLLSVPRSVHLEHRAPVRALAWSPWDRHILASGGGTADSTLKLWRASSGKLVQSVPTGAQVCALVWSTTTRQLVSAHGYGSDRNDLIIWNNRPMEQAHTLTGHTARVLDVALSPNGTTVVSSGADETLRFWNVFPFKAPGVQWTAKLSGASTSVIR